MDLMSLLFVLFLPAMAFVGGFYLIYRGWKRKGEVSSICGIARCKNPIVSPITGRRCIYAKAVIEYYVSGSSPWRTAWSSESKADFSVGRASVSSNYTEYQIREPQIFTGNIKRPKGMLETFVEPVTSSLPGSARVFLNDDLCLALMSVDAIKRAISPHISKVFRITEYAITEGSNVCVIDQSGLKRGMATGSMEFPLLISDLGSASAKSSLNEKAVFSIILGLALIFASVLLATFIILSI